MHHQGVSLNSFERKRSRDNLLFSHFVIYFTRAPPRCGCVLCVSVVLSLVQFRVLVASVQWTLKLSNVGSRAEALSLFWSQKCSEQRQGQDCRKQSVNPMLTSQTSLKIIRLEIMCTWFIQHVDFVPDNIYMSSTDHTKSRKAVRCKIDWGNSLIPVYT